MKYLLGSLLLIGYLPYLFLATSVETVKDSEREFHCHVKSMGEVKEIIGFGAVYYNAFRLKTAANHEIVLPYFFLHGDVKYASCAETNIILGGSDFIKVGDTIDVTADTKEIKIFGHTIDSEVSVTMFGSTSEKNFKEGEVVLTRLINDKEVQFFGGKRISK